MIDLGLLFNDFELMTLEKILKDETWICVQGL